MPLFSPMQIVGFPMRRIIYDHSSATNFPKNTGVIQELMTMDPYLGKYKSARLYLICYMWTHILCIHAENFVLLSCLDLTLC